MHIYGIQPTNQQTTSFKGAKRLLSKEIYYKRIPELTKLLEERSAQGKSTATGKLPPAIFKYVKNLPKAEKEVAIREIFDAFGETAKNIRNHEQTLVERFAPIKKVFEKYGIAEEGKFNVEEYILNGSRTGDYAIEGLNKNAGDTFFYRTVHDWEKPSKDIFKRMVNAQAYVKNNIGANTEQVKFYCADPLNGYIVSPNMSKAKTPFVKSQDINSKYGFLSYNDSKAHNHIFSYGYGYNVGVRNYALNESKVARYTAKQMEKATDKVAAWNDLYNNAKHLDEPQRIAGLAASIHLLPEEIQSDYIKKCLDYNHKLVDRSLAGELMQIENKQDVLKYLTELMGRKDSKLQDVVINHPFNYIDSKQPTAEQIQKLYYVIKPNLLPDHISKAAYMLKYLKTPNAMEEAAELIKTKDQKVAEQVLRLAGKQNDFYDKTTHLSVVNRRNLLGLVKKNNPEFYEAQKDDLVADVLSRMKEDLAGN